MVQTSACQKIGRCEGEKAAQYRNIKNSHGVVHLCIYVMFTVYMCSAI